MENWADMFKFLRLFFIISLTSIVVTIALLTLFYRHVTIQSTVSLSEANSLALAQAALISVRPELDDYLASAAAPAPRNLPLNGWRRGSPKSSPN